MLLLLRVSDTRKTLRIYKNEVCLISDIIWSHFTNSAEFRRKRLIFAFVGLILGILFTTPDLLIQRLEKVYKKATSPTKDFPIRISSELRTFGHFALSRAFAAINLLRGLAYGILSTV